MKSRKIPNTKISFRVDKLSSLMCMEESELIICFSKCKSGRGAGVVMIVSIFEENIKDDNLYFQQY